MLPLLLALALAAGPHIPVKLRRGTHGTASGGSGGSVPVPQPLGNPLPLCPSLLPGDQVGNWWCLNGDGTMAVGSHATLAPQSAPTVLLWDVCGGTNCTQETMTRLNPTTAATTEGYQTAANVAAPVGSFTTCWLGRVENPDSTTNVPAEELVTYGAGQWEMISGSPTVSNGLQTFAFGLPAPCNGGTGTCVNSGVTTVERVTVFLCSILNSGVQFTSCTYTQGTGATCVSAATASMQIDQTARKWGVGLAANGRQQTTGFFRGSFFTEKVLSTADVNRLGAQVLPSAPAAMLFTRASVKSCGSTLSTTRTVLLPPDMPCVNGDVAEREAAMSTSFKPTESTVLGNLSCTGGGCVAPVRTANAGFSPYGMKSVDQLDLGASGGGVASYFERSGLPAPTTVGDLVTYQADVMSVSGSRTIEICGNIGDGSISDYTSAPCAINASTYTTCTLTVTVTGTVSPITMRVGNCDTTVTRPAQSIYATDFNITKQASGLNSYIANPRSVGVPVTRAAEVCAGLNCPP